MSFKMCWYRSYSSSTPPHIVHHLMSVMVEAREGFQVCRIEDETYPRIEDDFRPEMQIFLTRWSNGWVVQSYIQPLQGWHDEGEGEAHPQPESFGTQWIVLDGQPIAYTWLNFDDASPDIHGAFRLTTSDGRLVPTGCGPQIDPLYRKSVASPEEALRIPWFNLPGATNLPGVPWEILEDAAKEAGILRM